MQMTSQGFQEKLSCMKWAEVELPENHSHGSDATFSQAVKALMVRTFSRKEVNTFKGVWRHPARGTGQICDALERGAAQKGGRLVFEANVLQMNSTHGKTTSVKHEPSGHTV